MSTPITPLAASPATEITLGATVLAPISPAGVTDDLTAASAVLKARAAEKDPPAVVLTSSEAGYETAETLREGHAGYCAAREHT